MTSIRSELQSLVYLLSSKSKYLQLMETFTAVWVVDFFFFFFGLSVMRAVDIPWSSMVHRSHHATIKVCSKSFVKQLLWFVFKHGHMPLDAEGDWVSWAMCKGFTYCYTLWVQPVLFHINISQRDQAPALCALPRGPRISQKTDTDTISR